MVERSRIGALPLGALFEIKEVLYTGLVHGPVIEDGINMVSVTNWRDGMSQGQTELFHRGILVDRIRRSLVPGVDEPAINQSYDRRRSYTLVPGVR